ncbi:MAG: hypothetical protein MJ093_02920 [Saccharofermentans sp.]|nr:hypothetical protein [Saccharofermentans sp.]
MFGKFDKWLKTASDEELMAVYDKERIEYFYIYGKRSKKMEKINDEITRRSVKKDISSDDSPKSNRRWTDTNRWE